MFFLSMKVNSFIYRISDVGQAEKHQRNTQNGVENGHPNESFFFRSIKWRSIYLKKQYSFAISDETYILPHGVFGAMCP